MSESAIDIAAAGDAPANAADDAGGDSEKNDNNKASPSSNASCLKKYGFQFPVFNDMVRCVVRGLPTPSICNSWRVYVHAYGRRQTSRAMSETSRLARQRHSFSHPHHLCASTRGDEHEILTKNKLFRKSKYRPTHAHTHDELTRTSHTANRFARAGGGHRAHASAGRHPHHHRVRRRGFLRHLSGQTGTDRAVNLADRIHVPGRRHHASQAG